MARVDERENLMKMAYEMDMQKDFTIKVFLQYTDMQMKGEPTEYFRSVYENLHRNLSQIDEKINEYSVKWKTSRMPSVDLAILRVALTEIYYIDNVPTSVAINEAVNLAKKYSTDKSSKFINGVLGKAAKEADAVKEAEETKEAEDAGEDA